MPPGVAYRSIFQKRTKPCPYDAALKVAVALTPRGISRFGIYARKAPIAAIKSLGLLMFERNLMGDFLNLVLCGSALISSDATT